MTNQQLAVSTENTSFVSSVLINPPSTETSLALRWQLVDVVTVLSSAGEPIASIVTGQAPTIVLAYPMSSLADVASVRILAPRRLRTPEVKVSAGPRATGAK
jgi:hypothetical protein